MTAPQAVSTANIVNNSVLFLSLSIFCETGGIQKVNRTMCKTLSDLNETTDDLHLLSLYDQTQDLDRRYLIPETFKGYNGNTFLFCIAAFLMGLRTKTIILSHVNLLPIAMLLKIFKPSVKIILVGHGTEIWRPLSYLKTGFVRKHIQIWAVSNYTAHQIIKTHHISNERIFILKNCLDPFFVFPTNFVKPSSLLVKYKLRATQPVLLGMHRLSVHEKDKGYDQIIRCMPVLLKEFPNLCYLLAGQCSKAEHFRLNRLIAKNNLEKNVKIIGFIPDQELIKHYLLADIFMLVSKKEGFGLVLIEAAACGRNIICGNRDGSSDAVLNGRLATQLDPDNQTILQDSILHLLKHPVSAKLSEHIQKTCRQHFSYPKYKLRVKYLLNS